MSASPLRGVLDLQILTTASQFPWVLETQAQMPPAVLQTLYPRSHLLGHNNSLTGLGLQESSHMAPATLALFLSGSIPEWASLEHSHHKVQSVTSLLVLQILMNT